jgi:hypothetical protein
MDHEDTMDMNPPTAQHGIPTTRMPAMGELTEESNVHPGSWVFVPGWTPCRPELTAGSVDIKAAPGTYKQRRDSTAYGTCAFAP